MYAIYIQVTVSKVVLEPVPHRHICGSIVKWSGSEFYFSLTTENMKNVVVLGFWRFSYVIFSDDFSDVNYQLWRDDFGLAVADDNFGLLTFGTDEF